VCEGFAVGVVHGRLEVIEVDAGEGFFDVQVTWFSVESEAVPVEDAVGGVRVLLDFVDEETRADGVEAAGGDEDGFARVGENRVHMIGDGSIGRIAVTTNLAAAMGAITAMITAWIVVKKPDASMALNGALAGLVAITAGCATVTPMGAIAIGLVGGILVVLSVLFIDKVLKIDDPVGAVSVHGVCGVWGTFACGLFNALDACTGEAAGTGLFYGGGFSLVGTQLTGIAVAFAWAFGLGLLLFMAIKMTIGLRVSREEELRGLDVGEHGMEAYAGFQIFSTT
jgi:ammonia channel protein AmtB